MNKKSYFIYIILILVLLHINKLYAKDKKAQDYLKRVDEMVMPGKDMTAVSETILISSDGKKEVRKMKTYRKGKKKIFFFISPPGVKGVAFLSLGDNRMYLYMPAYRKVRRIASSVKGDNFMGTDMSYDDMSETGYSEKFIPTIIKDSKDQVVLELRPKKDADTSYGKMVIWVDKKTWLRTQAEMYNKSGKLIKRMNVKKIKTIDGIPTPTEIEIESVESKHKTIFRLMDVHYNSGLKDSLFSKRKIRRIK